MRFTQVKLAAIDPQRLAAFYVAALECEVLLPLTRLAGEASQGVGSPGEKVEILVLSLPGGDGVPTLELIRMGDEVAGNAMLTFYVDDVAAAADRIVREGGSWRGEIVDLVGPSGATSQFVFMADPEGNTIDLMTRV